MSRKPARWCGLNVFHDPAPDARAAINASNSRGWTLLELMVGVSILGLLMAMAMPRIQTTLLNYRLGAAAASVASAIQQTRYTAIMNGCYYTIAFSASSTTYQVQTQTVSGTPPACATNADGSPKFTNAPYPLGPAAIPWTTGAGVSVTSSTTLEFGPNGVVGVPPSPATNPLAPCTSTTTGCSFQVSNGNATRTIAVSGVGSVKVTSP